MSHLDPPDMFLKRREPTDTLAQYQTKVIYKSDINTGQLEQILVPEFKPNNAIILFAFERDTPKIRFN